ncbi:AI-2E family transporter [Irregularibacter muris]|uniref:AI-2E family transporter n=1 Tax=Irregularibacter muris TaxID=1796619 RepID=A0AAE3KZC4_9FIRM|nr:AI-2E family transporter [Irregularibacter muris]MCR1898995.1 AI-2E family transporter [Irregularibacter muris]
MKFEFDKKYLKLSVYVFLALAALILFYKVIDNFSSAFDSFRIIIDFFFTLLKPFIMAIAIAYFLYPLIRWVETRFFNSPHRLSKKNKRGRILSILVIYILIIILLGTFLYLTTPRIVKNISDLITVLPNYVEEAGDFFKELNMNKKIQDFIRGLPIDNQMLTQYDFFKNIDQYVNNIFKNAQNAVEGILGYLVNSAVSLTSGLLNLVLAIFIAFYILKDKEELFRSLRRFFEAFFPHKTVKRWREILYLADEKFGEYLIGNIIDSTIIGLMCFIGLLVLKIKFALLISIIIGVTNLIPYFGPIIGAVPGIILTLFDSPIKALWLAIFILVLQQFDGNYLKPKVLGDKVGLSPLWVIFAIVIGGGLFGVWGMFLGVPTIAVIRVILLQAIEKRNNSI